MESQVPIVEKLRIQENMLDLLNEHHIVGLFFSHYSNPSCQKIYIEHYKKQWIHNHMILEELTAISTSAFALETSATILKGSHLLLDLYKDIGSRFLSDIDLLISPKDQFLWETALSKLGYEATTGKTFYGNNYKLEWSKTIGEVEINVELHTKLFFHLEVVNWQLEKTSFLNLTKLKQEDLYIHLCGHLASQHNFIKLYWLFDIFLYHQKFADQMDWSSLKLKSKNHGLFRSVQMCIWILGHHFEMKLEKNIVELFDLNKKQWWKKLLTVDFLMYPFSNKYHYFLLKHATKDRLTTALRYDLTWFFHYKIRTIWSK